MTPTDLNRRFFLRGKIRPSSKADPSTIRPPWSLKEPLFVEACTRCNQCISTCPEEIIIRGSGGFPEIDFKKGECTFCGNCIRSCEAKAFQAISPTNLHNENAWNLKVEILPECLSINAVVCRVCGDNCEEQAISFRLKPGGISIPVIDNEDCTGCGGCLFSCPKNTISIKVNIIDVGQVKNISA